MKRFIFLLFIFLNCVLYQSYIYADTIELEETSTEVSSNTTFHGHDSLLELPKPTTYNVTEPILGGVQPKYYNAMQENLVTSYKDQHNTSLCWAFTVCGVIETNLAKKGLPLVSLSPYYLAKATVTPMDYGDDAMTAGYVSDADIYDEAGSFLKALTTLRRGHGLQPLSIYDYYNTLTCSLSPNTDLPYTLNKYEIYQGCNEFNSYEDFETTLDIIKTNLINYGSAYVALNMTCEGLPLSEDNMYYLSYSNVPIEAKHAVQIIGYDDDFSKTNFGARQPKHDGVFICKQTYGLDVNYAPTFYVPYEDMSIDEICFLDMIQVDESSDKSDYLGAICEALRVKADKTPCSFFSVFRNNTDGVINITDVSADFFMYGFQGTVQIFKNPEFRRDAEFTRITDKPCYKCSSGTPMLDEPVPFSNYACSLTRVALPQAVSIAPNETYQIVFTIDNKEVAGIISSDICITSDTFIGTYDDFLNDKLYGDIYVKDVYISDERVQEYKDQALTKNCVSIPMFNNIGIQAYYTTSNKKLNKETFNCNYKGRQYTVILNTNKGDCKLPEYITVGYKLPKPKKTGFKFKYWLCEGRKVSKISRKVLNNAHSDTLTFAAYYEPIKYKVYYVSLPPDNKSFPIGTLKTKTVRYNEKFYLSNDISVYGYTLVGWSCGDSVYPINEKVCSLTTNKQIYLMPIWVPDTTVN